MTGDDTDRNPAPGESDLEWRLHAMLDARAEQLDPQLHGPQLRAAAGPRSSTIRRAAPAFAVAATVAALAVGVAVATTRSPAPSRRPVQPGGAGVTSSSTPDVTPTVAPPTPVTTPTATPRVSGRSIDLPPAPTTVTTPSGPGSAGLSLPRRRRTTTGPSVSASGTGRHRPAIGARPSAPSSSATR